MEDSLRRPPAAVPSRPSCAANARTTCVSGAALLPSRQQQVAHRIVKFRGRVNNKAALCCRHMLEPQRIMFLRDRSKTTGNLPRMGGRATGPATVPCPWTPRRRGSFPRGAEPTRSPARSMLSAPELPTRRGADCPVRRHPSAGSPDRELHASAPVFPGSIGYVQNRTSSSSVSDVESGLG